MTEAPRPRIGETVNGFRWDGRQWVPLTPGAPTYPRPGPQPGPGMNPYRTQPGPGMNPYQAQPQQAPSPGWATRRTVAPPARAAGWTPPAAGRRPAGSPATRRGKPSWLLWALGALVVVVVAYAVVSSLGSPPGGGGDADVKAGVAVIARGCSAFAGATGSGPGVSDVRPDGAVAQYVADWPTNPFTGQPMTPGTQPGDYRFSTAIRMPGGEYRGYVSGVLSNGETYSVEFTY